FIGKILICKNFMVKIQIAFLSQMLLIVLMIITSSIISNIFTLVTLAFLIHITAGFIFNNYFTYCLGRFPQIAGTAGGVTGGLAYSLTSILSYGKATVIKPVLQLTVGLSYYVIVSV